jgi:hypothetical protein
MDFSNYKVALMALDRVRKGDYSAFNTKVPFDEMIRLYDRLVFCNEIKKIEDLEFEIKKELKKWAFEIGFGTNIIKGKNICKCLYLLTYEFKKVEV